MSDEPTQTAPGILYTDPSSGALRARRYRVQVTAGPDAGIHAELQHGTFLIGSHASTDLRLTDKSVSRYHVELQLGPTGLKITDLDSTNGTFQADVGNARIGSITLPTTGNAKPRFRIGTHTEIELAAVDDPIATAGWQATHFGGVTGGSRPMRALFGLLARVAPADMTILLDGETGTGKTLLAEAIHRHSARKEGPFVVVDCGALPKDLIGAELFGYTRGAFTGAVADKRGLVESANGGTLFLDEIGELPLDLQPQLLRLLERREIRAVGQISARKIDVRVVAGTHRNLAERVKARQFREDLFFRLAVVRATVPPLRKRKEDLPALVRDLVRELGKGDFALSPDVLAQLMAHDWPGNVRELRNVVERGLVLDDQLDLPVDAAAVGPSTDGAPARSEAPNPLLDMSFKDAKELLTDAFERDYLTHLLARHHGNVSRAAQEAGIDRNHIHRLVKKHKLPSPR